MRVYLAGKIKGSDEWRDQLVKFSGGSEDESFYPFAGGWSGCVARKTELCNDDAEYWEVLGSAVEKPRWPILKRSFLGIADYVGPYAVASFDEDTCKPHNSCFEPPRGLLENTQPLRGAKHEANDVRMKRISSLCIRAIDRTDVVVVVATEDSPGTLCEIGYAVARSKPVFALSRGKSLDWFPASLCQVILERTDGPSFWGTVEETLKDNLFRWATGWAAANLRTYYRSRWWRARRMRALNRVGDKCQFCSASTGLQVHHNNYKNLFRELHSDLVVLCDSCHKAADSRRRAQEKLPQLKPTNGTTHEPNLEWLN